MKLIKGYRYVAVQDSHLNLVSPSLRGWEKVLRTAKGQIMAD